MLAYHLGLTPPNPNPNPDPTPNPNPDPNPNQESLLLDTVEAQKQTTLLEKKISLERETQAALDPEVGAAEVRAMQREILP